MFKYLIIFITTLCSSHTIAEDIFQPETKVKIHQFSDTYLDKSLPINTDFLKSYEPNIKISNNVIYKIDLTKIEMKLFKDADSLNKLKLLIPYNVEENTYSIGRYALVVCPIFERKNTISFEKGNKTKIDGSYIIAHTMKSDSIITRLIDPGYYILSGKPQEKVIMTKLSSGNILPSNKHPINSKFIILCQSVENELLSYEIEQLKNKIDQQKKIQK